MKRTTLIAITVGSILGTALTGAYGQQAPPSSQQPIPAPQVITPKAGASAPQTSPAVAQAERGPATELSFPLGTPLEEIELRVIRETLRHAKGDKSVAAQLLGISTRTIYRKLGELE